MSVFANCKRKGQSEQMIPRYKKVPITTPAQQMATVSITSDLEPYLASLRSYLAKNNIATPRPVDEEGADEMTTDSTDSSTAEDSRRESKRFKKVKEDARADRRLPMLQKCATRLDKD
ncbi:uncharacterized protein ATNIH1004_010165 [Aspergillus tanneri]|uniref:Uncharacterized protein n=1 Tax=Aspergillus tanneri TaxID=1220188 RepID=A0A5M9MCF2_9EURO|nr:uncharacterized protein ATNIH1004_010165 [Aspergillus tanneri]KAA8643396.1 hypothetical protein ATNIH1004_010165 [Aspergillus tanneri]